MSVLVTVANRGTGFTAGTLPILANGNYLRGYSSAAVALNLIGVTALNAINIDQSTAAGGILIGQQPTTNINLPAASTTLSYTGLNTIFNLESNANNNGDSIIAFYKNRAGAIVQNNDGIGRYRFRAWDGVDYLSSGQLQAVVDAVPGIGNIPTRLVFSVSTGAAQAEALRLTSGLVTRLFGPLQLRGFTVATLPAGVQGYLVYVTDALAPAFGAAVVGGGAVVTPVFYDGVNWTVR